MFSWIKNFLADCSTYLSSYESDTSAGSSSDDHSSYDFGDDHQQINPATGLIMVGGMGGIDTSGSPFGIDLNSHCTHDDPSPTYDHSYDSFSTMDHCGTADMFSSNSFGDY